MKTYRKFIHILLLHGQTRDIHCAELLQQCAKLVVVKPTEVEGGQVLAHAIAIALGIVLRDAESAALQHSLK